MAECPVCGRGVPGDEFGRIAFHYQRAAEPLRVCVAVGARRDDFGVIARLQLAHAGVLAPAAAPVLERVAVAIEARTAVARASEERAAKSADLERVAVMVADYLRALVKVTDDDSGPVPSLVDDADDGSH